MMNANPNIDALISLLKRNPAGAIKTDEDLACFCEDGFELIRTASEQSIAADRPIWEKFELALALREGAADSNHIDFDHVSAGDHKVFIMLSGFSIEHPVPPAWAPTVLGRFLAHSLGWFLGVYIGSPCGR